LDEHIANAARIAAANLVATSAPAILDELGAALWPLDGPFSRDELTRSQVLAHAPEILDRAHEELAAAAPPAQHRLATQTGIIHADAGLDPDESSRAADILFRTVICHVGAQLGAEHAIQQVVLVALALHTVLARAERIAADTHLGLLLDQVHHAQVEERRRISRELHDHIANGIGVAQRDLELFEIYRLTDPDRALVRARDAQRRLADAMETVRLAIGELRLVEPIESLEKGLRLFLESAADPQLERQVKVNGDERWIPAWTRDESFLIIRESLRNVIAHSGAARVVVRVDIKPDELRTSVVDNGRGFDLAAECFGGTGLLSMRERAALLGGSLTLNSLPGVGTHVRLRVPLAGEQV
jgi:signal transduction histidine kinase